MTQEAAEKLRAARELIARPGGWTQGALARDASGNGTWGDSSNAVCWCSWGVIRAVAVYPETKWKMLNFIRDATDTDSVANWNDAPGRTQAEVVDAFDRAIALAEAEAA